MLPVRFTSLLLTGAGLLLTVTAFGQPVIRSGNLPGEGDTYVMALDLLPANIQPLAPDKEQRWDFTALQAPYSRKFTWAKAGSGNHLTGPGPHFSEALYIRTGNELRLQQTNGQDPFGLSPDTRTVYAPAMPVRKLPQRLGSTFQYSGVATATAAADDLPSELLRKLPLRPDSVRLKVNIKLLSETNTWGKVLIPGGIFEALREKQTFTYTFQVEIKIGQRRWQNISTSASVKDLFPKTTLITYTFWSDESLEPIAVLTMDRSGYNTEKVEFKVTDIQEIPLLKSSSLDFFAYPNPAIADIRLEFFMHPPGDYEVIIGDMIGNIHFKKKFFVSGNQIEKLNLSQLAKGPYFLYIKDDRGIIVGKSKRLIVIRP